MAADDDSKSRRSRGGTFGVWSALFCGALALTALLDTFFFADDLPSLGDGDAGDAASAPAEDVVATLEAELAAETRKRDVVVEKLAREKAAAARSAAAAAREVHEKRTASRRSNRQRHHVARVLLAAQPERR